MATVGKLAMVSALSIGFETYNGNTALATHSEYGPRDRRVQTRGSA
jgi:hypothetical protein